MFEPRKWKRAELEMVNALLRHLPERHIRYNEGFAELVREDYLTGKDKTSLSAAGVYRTRGGSMILFHPAFWDPVALGATEIPAIHFTLLALVGYSLFTTLEVKKGWPPIMYPRYDRGPGARALVKIVDRELLPQELQLRGGELYMDPKLVSLDRSFAYCYACYVLAPENLLRSFPEAYQYLKTRIFAGREYRAQQAMSGKHRIRV